MPPKKARKTSEAPKANRTPPIQLRLGSDILETIDRLAIRFQMPNRADVVRFAVNRWAAESFGEIDPDLTTKKNPKKSEGAT